MDVLPVGFSERGLLSAAAQNDESCQHCCGLPMPLTFLLLLLLLLLQRVRRREFILEHGLLSVRRMQGLEKRRMAGERERTAQMRVFARWVHTVNAGGVVAI
jgi:hypothetical protein